jgi:hypothetical protein
MYYNKPNQKIELNEFLQKYEDMIDLTWKYATQQKL